LGIYIQRKLNLWNRYMHDCDILSASVESEHPTKWISIHFLACSS
jgi:hypothetical protein